MIHRMLKGLIVAAWLCALPAVAQADIFMLVTGVAGDRQPRATRNGSASRASTGR